MEEKGQGECGGGHEVGGGVGEESGVGYAVGGVDNGERFFAAMGVGYRG